MANAIELAQFYLFEAKRLAEAATVTEEIDRAEELRRWIMEIWQTKAVRQNRDPLTIVPRDAVNFGPNSIRETVTVKKLMKVLADHGWLAQLDAGTVIDGKARQLAYRVVRAV